MCNSEIYTYTKKGEIQIIVKHIRPTAMAPIGVKIALLVLEEVCEYHAYPLLEVGYLYVDSSAESSSSVNFHTIIEQRYIIPKVTDGSMSMPKPRLPYTICKRMVPDDSALCIYWNMRKKCRH